MTEEKCCCGQGENQTGKSAGCGVNKESAGCGVNKESAGCGVNKESAGCEVRGAEQSALRTTHDAHSLNEVRGAEQQDALRTTHDAHSLTQSQAAKCCQDGPWQPKVVAFLCNWCSYAGADLAGISRIQYPPNIRIIRVPCSGRINPVFILKALQTGADGVLISGCHPGDCHYVSGNYYARRKFEIFDRLLDYIGLEPGRVFFSWVSAAEGENFGRLIKHVVDEVEKLGPANKLVKML